MNKLSNQSIYKSTSTFRDNGTTWDGWDTSQPFFSSDFHCFALGIIPLTANIFEIRPRPNPIKKMIVQVASDMHYVPSCRLAGNKIRFEEADLVSTMEGS